MHLNKYSVGWSDNPGSRCLTANRMQANLESKFTNLACTKKQHSSAAAVSVFGV